MQTEQEQNFHEACKKGDIQKVKDMLLLELDFNARDDFWGQTPFFYACERGHKEIVKLLLQDSRIDATKEDMLYNTPFFVACERGHKEIVEMLLKYSHIDVNKENMLDRAPFFVACSFGNKEIVELLLKNERIDVNKANKHGNTPFFVACENGHKEIVELLLQDSRLDLSKELAQVTLSDYAYKTLYQAFFYAANKILLSSQNLISIASTSKVCTLISNIKAILYPNKNDSNYTKLQEAQHKIFSFVEEKKITELKEKLSSLEPALALTMMVLLSDGFVTIKDTAPDEIKRFFKITQQLPIEIQIEIAQKIFYNTKNNVPTRDVDWAIISLLRSYGEDIEVAGEYLE